MSDYSQVALLESTHDREQFYTKHGFIPSPADPLRLFFPLDPLRK